MSFGAIKSEEPIEIFDYNGIDEIDLTAEDEELEQQQQQDTNAAAANTVICDVIELDDDDDDDDCYLIPAAPTTSSVSDFNDLQHHMVELVNFMCSICQEVLPTTELHQQHMLAHDAEQTLLPQPKDTEMPQMQLCSSNDILSQSNQQTGRCRKRCCNKPALNYCCVQCSEKFSSRRAFERHLKEHNRKKLPYACTLCPKAYLTFAALIIHETSHETAYRPYKCDKCGVSFQENQQLKSHLKMHQLVQSQSKF